MGNGNLKGLGWKEILATSALTFGSMGLGAYTGLKTGELIVQSTNISNFYTQFMMPALIGATTVTGAIKISSDYIFKKLKK